MKTKAPKRDPVYADSRDALDIMENDLMGCLSFKSGQQRFILEDGGNDQAGGAADRIVFRTTTTVADSLQTCEVEYVLVPSPVGTKKSDRVSYALLRKVRVLDPNKAPTEPWDALPKDRGGRSVPNAELCRSVAGFNLEYFSGDQSFMDLQPSPCPPADPLGDGKGANDVGAKPLRIGFIRVTLWILGGETGEQERSIQKAMWIPMG